MTWETTTWTVGILAMRSSATREHVTIALVRNMLSICVSMSLRYAASEEFFLVIKLINVLILIYL